MATESVAMPVEAIPDLRRMLTIGMAALAEVERLSSAGMGEDLPENLKPIHPTGCDEMGEFATALMWIDIAERAKARA